MDSMQASLRDAQQSTRFVAGLTSVKLCVSQLISLVLAFSSLGILGTRLGARQARRDRGHGHCRIITSR